jgi:hypothetical protein
MTTEYPVQVDVTSPLRFDRVQLLLRIALSIILGWIGITAGWLICMLFGVLPLIAAIAISSVGATRYHSEVAPRVWRVLRWLLELWAYMALLVDRFPVESGDVRIDSRFTGTPTIGSALSRLITSIPSGIVLCVLWFASGVVWLVAAVIILLGATMPPSIIAFQRGVLRWQTRLVAYHASLVEEYPPFSMDTDETSTSQRASQAQ